MVTAGAPTTATEHLLPRALVDQLVVEAGPAGVILGLDAERKPVRLRLLRPTPTRVSFVGGDWAARLLVFRLLALGARVPVRANDPRSWIGLDGLVNGAGNRVWPVPAEQVLDLPADDTAPVVHLHSPGAGGIVARVPLGPWQTQLTVLGQVTSTVTAALSESDLVLLQRLSEPEAVLADAGLGLGAETTQWLRTMPDEAIVAVSRHAEQALWLVPTSVERHLFGPPAR